MNYYDPEGLLISVPSESKPRIIWVVWLVFESWEEVFTRIDLGVEAPLPGGRTSAGGSPTNPRQRMLAQRAKVLGAIYGVADNVFGPHILDCMAGRESDWDPEAVNPESGARGMFQIREVAWLDVYGSVPKPPPYPAGAHDPELRAQFAVRYLRILLERQRGVNLEYDEDDLKAALIAYNAGRRRSRAAEKYAEQILECARKLKERDLDSALRAIGK